MLHDLVDGLGEDHARRIEDLGHELAGKVLEIAVELAMAHAAGDRGR